MGSRSAGAALLLGLAFAGVATAQPGALSPAYAAAVERYASGERDVAIAAVAALSQRDLRQSVEALGSRVARLHEALVQGDGRAGPGRYPMERPGDVFDPSTRQTQLNLGRGREARQRLERARRLLRDAIAVDPSLHEVRLRLGRVAWRLGDAYEARAAFEAVLA
ncbi:MAG TPA: hypothetical protein VJ648_14225, partial [Vicinamibacteria bacterium]|nr:hypothetical protein [Vicinamibacteria bacterium]